MRKWGLEAAMCVLATPGVIASARPLSRVAPALSRQSTRAADVKDPAP